MSKPINLEERRLTPIGRWLNTTGKEVGDFTPSRQMERAKARMWDGIKNNPYMSTKLEDLTLDALIHLSGQPKLMDWMEKHPYFLSWLCDENYEKFDLEAAAAAARRVIEDILLAPLEEKLLTAKDKLNAANLLLQLADKFPNKRRELVYLDKDLGKMGAEDVDRESKRIDKLLSAGKTDVDNET